MKELKPSDFPLRDSPPFTPTSLLYLQSPDRPSLTTLVQDITSNSSPDSSLKDAKKAASEHSAILTIRRKSLFSRIFSCANPTGAHVAQVSNELLSFSHWHLVFPEGSPHSGHDIELRPVGLGRKADIFVQSSVPHFWDAEGTTLKLFKVVDGGRVEVARLRRKHTRDRGGMLAVDDTRMDRVVAVMTCVAVLMRTDSFRK